MKTCTICGKTQDLEHFFYKGEKGTETTGRNVCKTCRSARRYTKNETPLINCSVCGKEFSSTNYNCHLCSDECKKSFLRKYDLDRSKKDPNNTLAKRIKKYGLSLDSFILLLEEQKGLCAVCQKPFEGKRASIDHDHSCCDGPWSCGKCIRGLIHNNCNAALGLLKDDPDRVFGAYQYLLKYNERINTRSLGG